MAFGVIYLITNLLNSMKYVGQTKRPLKERISEHKRGDQYIDRAIKKYGWENFSIEVLEECDSFEQLNEREKFWIATLNTMSPNGYNLNDGGRKIEICSKETRAKLSAASSGENNGFFGKHHTKETKARLSEINRGENNPLFGKHPTKETREKIGAKSRGKKGMLGKSHSATTRAKISLKNSGKKRTLEQRVKLSVTQRGESPFKNLLNEIDKQQLTYHALAKLMGIAQQSVSSKMSGKRKFNENEIAKLVKIFGKPAEYLMARDDE